MSSAVCKEAITASDERTRIYDAKELLNRHLRERRAFSNEQRAADITNKEQFREQYREYHARRGSRNYEMMRQDFLDDIEILQDILQNAFIYAIDIEKPFLAKEQKIIEDIKTLVEQNTFAHFIANNIGLIKQEEYSAIVEKEKQEQMNRAYMQRVKELLMQLDEDCAE